MNKPIDTIKLIGEITVELIDKKTKKVVLRKKFKNALIDSGAFYIMTLIDSGGDALSGHPAWKVVNLFDSNKAFIKSITGSWGTKTDTGSEYKNTLEAEDTSSDEYTVEYLELDEAECTDYVSCGRLAQHITPVQKTADKILKVTWTVRVPYYARP